MRLILSTREVMLDVLRRKALSGPVLSSEEALQSYLRLSMGWDKRECFRVLFLNSQNRLVGDEILAVGSAMGARVYPREILRLAFDLGATALILVHNHPSGECHPSTADIALTRTLARLGAEFDLTIHDHLIIARSGASSLRALGLLEDLKR